MRLSYIGYLIVLCCVSGTTGQTIGTACTHGGIECGTTLHLECDVSSGLCVCSDGYSNDGNSNCDYDCGALTSPTNGDVQAQSGTTTGDQATYTCTSGYNLDGSSVRTCQDGTGWDGTEPTCEPDIDECSSNPCQNGGTCSDGVNSYTCSCMAGYTGDMCETDINECTSNPCQNGGTCNDVVNMYTCSCVAGYSDTNCETNIDECSSTPCQNGGTCSDGFNGYTCSCMAGYTGISCETDIDECSSTPCQNGGTCSDGVNGYTCSCMVGYTGDMCETDIDECASTPCQNGGTCSDGVNGYTCSCLTGYAGDACETGCPTLTPPLNGYVNATSYDAGSIATYSCMSGHILVGSNERTCLSDFQWSFDEPNCYIECPTLSIDHGSADLSSGSWETSVATYICDNGYALVGIPTRTCTSSGIWSGVKPECVISIFPDVLLVFGFLIGFLILIDVFILVVCIYHRYCKDQSAKNKSDSIEDADDEEELQVGNPGLTSVTLDTDRTGRTRKTRQAKIAPGTSQKMQSEHPPPKHPSLNPEMMSYFFKNKKTGALGQSLAMKDATRTTQMSDGPRLTKFKNDRHLTPNSDDPVDHNASSKPVNEQLSINLEDSDRTPANEENFHPKPKSLNPMDDVIKFEDSISLPEVPDSPWTNEKEEEGFFSEDKRGMLKRYQAANSDDPAIPDAFSKPVDEQISNDHEDSHFDRTPANEENFHPKPNLLNPMDDVIKFDDRITSPVIPDPPLTNEQGEYGSPSEDKRMKLKRSVNTYSPKYED